MRSWNWRISLLILCLMTLLAMESAGVSQALSVPILLRPDDPPPAIIAPRSSGMVPVGILTTDSFDALSIAPATLRLGPTGTEAALIRVNRTDVDRDGDTDLQAFFAIQDLGVTCEDTALMLKGRTTDQQDIEGTASIVTEGC